MAADLQQRIRWMALHGVIRVLSKLGTRRGGDPQARLIADPVVREDPSTFADELRDARPAHPVPCGADDRRPPVASELLRSEDFRVISLGSGLPARCAGWSARTRDNLLHPLRPPSLLSVEPPDAHPLPQDGVVGVHQPRGEHPARPRRGHRRGAAGRAVRGPRGRRRRGRLLLPAAGRGDQRHPRSPRRRPAPRAGVRRTGRAQPRLGVSWPQYQRSRRASPASTPGSPTICKPCASIRVTI